jgi:predicted dinucleotide-binding enzyme
MRVTVLGYDSVGESAAKTLKALGHEVQVQDDRHDLQVKAEADGFPSSLIRPDVTFICATLESTSAVEGLLAANPGVVAVPLPQAPEAIAILAGNERVACVAAAADGRLAVEAGCQETASFVRALWHSGEEAALPTGKAQQGGQP